MPSCFITGLHVYDNRGLCACGEKGRPWASRQEERKRGVAITTDNRTNEPSDALALVEEVIAIHADRIDTHYGDCYKYHVACLAVAVKHRLAGKEKNE